MNPFWLLVPCQHHGKGIEHDTCEDKLFKQFGTRDLIKLISTLIILLFIHHDWLCIKAVGDHVDVFVLQRCQLIIVQEFFLFLRI